MRMLVVIDCISANKISVKGALTLTEWLSDHYADTFINQLVMMRVCIRIRVKVMCFDSISASVRV